MTDYEVLAALAEAATEGPWVVVGAATQDDAKYWIETAPSSPSVASICLVSTDQDDEPEAVYRDAAFIAAANPTTVLALIADLAASHRSFTSMDQIAASEKARADAAEAEVERLTHLLGSHADGHLCTCTMLTGQTPWEPAEWEQDPWCPTHPNMTIVIAEVERLRGVLSDAGVERVETENRADAAEAVARQYERERDAARAEVERLRAHYEAALSAANTHGAAVARVRAVCDRHERGALRWEHPLPVPEWIADVRRALDGGDE